MRGAAWFAAGFLVGWFTTAWAAFTAAPHVFGLM